MALHKIGRGDIEPPDSWFTPEEKIAYDFAKFNSRAFQ